MLRVTSLQKVKGNCKYSKGRTLRLVRSRGKLQSARNIEERENEDGENILEIRMASFPEPNITS